MSKIIESNNGVILDLNTDAISFITKDNKLPFTIVTEYNDPKFNDDYYVFDELNERVTIDGYFYDDKKTIHKYKLEDKEGRLAIPKLQGYKGTENYELIKKEWKITKDVSNNDFKQLVDQVVYDIWKNIPDEDEIFKYVWDDITTNISEKKGISSCLIKARGGTGKSHLMKQIQAKLDENKIEYVTMAPTNVACININGTTIDLNVNRISNNMKGFTAQVVFIDEIGMVSEKFLKFFSTLKRMKPELKFVLCGDWTQLEPICDRVKDADYENAPVIYELVDGNMIALSKCRRSDDTIFNMTKPENIKHIDPSKYGKKLCDINLCWTNKKRKNINAGLMMKHKKDKVHVEVDYLKYDTNTQNIYVYSGLPLISRKTCTIKNDDKSVRICRNEMFKVLELSLDRLNVNIVSQIREEIKFTVPVKEFALYFKPGYAITVHSSQSLTISEDITIHQFDMFSDRMKYVAISRCQNVNQLNFK